MFISQSEIAIIYRKRGTNKKASQGDKSNQIKVRQVLWHSFSAVFALDPVLNLHKSLIGKQFSGFHLAVRHQMCRPQCSKDTKICIVWTLQNMQNSTLYRDLQDSWRDRACKQLNKTGQPGDQNICIDRVSVHFTYNMSWYIISRIQGFLSYDSQTMACIKSMQSCDILNEADELPLPIPEL
jgi:hypothetical protein